LAQRSCPIGESFASSARRSIRSPTEPPKGDPAGRSGQVELAFRKIDHRSCAAPAPVD
jgi:hypothetical protein